MPRTRPAPSHDTCAGGGVGSSTVLVAPQQVQELQSVRAAVLCAAAAVLQLGGDGLQPLHAARCWHLHQQPRPKLQGMIMSVFQSKNEIVSVN